MALPINLCSSACVRTHTHTQFGASRCLSVLTRTANSKSKDKVVSDQMYSGGSPSRLRQSRKDACPTRMTFNPHCPGAITPHDVRKSTASLSEELRRPVPTLCPLLQRKKNRGEKNAETEPHRKSSRICGKGVGEIYILFCFMFFFLSFSGKSKKKKAEFEISLIKQL